MIDRKLLKKQAHDLSITSQEMLSQALYSNFIILCLVLVKASNLLNSFWWALKAPISQILVSGEFDGCCTTSTRTSSLPSPVKEESSIVPSTVPSVWALALSSVVLSGHPTSFRPHATFLDLIENTTFLAPHLRIKSWIDVYIDLDQIFINFKCLKIVVVQNSYPFPCISRWRCRMVRRLQVWANSVMSST